MPEQCPSLGVLVQTTHEKTRTGDHQKPQEPGCHGQRIRDAWLHAWKSAEMCCCCIFPWGKLCFWYTTKAAWGALWVSEFFCVQWRSTDLMLHCHPQIKVLLKCYQTQPSVLGEHWPVSLHTTTVEPGTASSLEKRVPMQKRVGGFIVSRDTVIHGCVKDIHF